MNVQGADSTMSWRMHLQEADTPYLEAKVLVESSSYVSPGATAIARIGGWFYNDSRGEGSGQEHNGYEGDVWADNRIILDENNKLVAKAFLWRTNNADDTSDAELFGQEFSTPVNFDTEYTLSIEFTGTAFVFKCNENVLSYQLTTPAYPPSENDIQLTSRIYADSGEFGYIKATFDDVCITKGGAPYDNFEADTIDLSKWAESEYVREISEGKLRLNIRGYDQKSTTDVYLTNGDTFYYEGKVFFESDSHVSPETPGVAGLSGWFYNDSRGPGSMQNHNGHEGDVWLDIRIILDENRNLTAKASATRSDNAENSLETDIFEQYFSGPINLDAEYVLSIEVRALEILFKCNDESLSYPLTTPVYKPYRNNKRLMSRIYADPGESGYVKAWFDDVSVTKRPTPPPLADAGQDQKIDEGKTVILDASHSSHPDGTIASYQWNQIEGPSVTLSDPSAASPTFAAPEVDSNEVALIFRVTVIDEEGLQNTDACVIYLTDVVFDDSDEDGMADNWEIKYFDTLGRDGFGDFDRDGISDVDEYLNGTDPLKETPGDINQDKQIDLTDAIIALKIISGIDPDTVVRKVADINGDGKIGTEEAIYALQIAGGMEIPTNEVSGHVSEDTTWSGDIKVTGEITVDDDITLTINPGTYVEFQGHYKLNVRGTLIAEGTPEERITFTAKNSFEGWHGIRFDNDDRDMDDNDPSEIVYCNLQYGNATDSDSATSGHDDAGGAIFVYNFSDLLISNCVISNNRASHAGGGIYCFYSQPVLTNNVIVNNSAADYGGGIYFMNSGPRLTNNTISKNIATTGGGICCHNNSGPTLTNTILWENTAEYGSQVALLQNTCDPHFYYCNIQGGLPAFGGAGADSDYDISRYKNNIGLDPLFAVPSYSAGADFDGLSADWTLQAASPCINAGDPATAADSIGATDMAGNPRILGDAIDIGAYEYQE